MKQLHLLLMLVLLAGCSLQKRRYLPGFYVHSNKPVKEQNNAFKFTQVKKITGKPLTNKAQDESTPEKNFSQTPVKNSLSYETVKKYLKALNPDSCDLILLKSGEEIRAKIVEASETEIKYRRCDGSKVPIYIVNKIAVTSISYASGAKELTGGTDYVKPRIEEADSGPVYHPLALVAIGFAINPLTCVAGAIAGVLAIRKIGKSKENYLGKGLSVFAIALSLLAIYIFATLLFIPL